MVLMNVLIGHLRRKDEEEHINNVSLQNLINKFYLR